MKKLVTMVVMIFAASVGSAALKSQTIIYKHGGANLEGYLVYDDAIQGKRPGVVVVHEWWGHNDYVNKRADQLASLGYVAFALDMYGKGQVTDDFKKAAEISGVFKSDRNLMRARANAGLKVLLKNDFVDDKRIAAMGYCFGGTVALEMARAGMDLKGVVSFHGGLDTPDPSDAKKIKGKVLVLTGGDDYYVPAAQVAAFEDEMKKANVDWQVNVYSHAVHGFTNAANRTDNSKGLAYNAEADARSWEAMKAFFIEIFK
jgi:dienelactone hydrolase